MLFFPFFLLQQLFFFHAVCQARRHGVTRPQTLRQGGALPAPPDGDDEAAREGSAETEETLRAARGRAAGAMRDALLTPATRVRSALRDRVDTLRWALLTPMSRVQGAIRGAAGLPSGREALDPAWGEQVPVPRAASAVYRALIVIAEQRLSQEAADGEEADQDDEER